MKKYLKETRILDYSHPSIQRVIEQRYWKNFEIILRIKAIYNYVRDEIKFALDSQDVPNSSQVMMNGSGDSITKSILLMSFLRAVGIPCRIHGMVISKSVIKGVSNGFFYKVSPDNFLHSLVEIYVDEDWYIMEGMVLDNNYLKGVSKLHKAIEDENMYFNFESKEKKIDFENLKTYPFWKESIAGQELILQDLGVFESPDKFYMQYPKKSNPIKTFIFENFIRHRINKRIDDIRNQ
ncbi:transglutaminase-like domain-containing protein [Sphingobacterium spiritivorum]|uniref:transglutaminase-like domain-containing protein n=1 Tax=Sphingobacterium spiritivorum TaxID=258 RepID=UPI003DA397AD